MMALECPATIVVGIMPAMSDDKNGCSEPFPPHQIAMAVVAAAFTLTAGYSLSHSTAASPGPSAVSTAPASISVGIDPNTAAWWELATLPRIGETMARRIITFRDAQRHQMGDASAAVFHCAEDLDAVQGIGPATIRAIRPYLRFNGKEDSPAR